MHDMPEHLMVPIDEDGNGPVGQSETWGYRCWCNTDCGTVQHVLNTEGGAMCEDMAREGMAVMLIPGTPQGFCPKCHAYTMGLFKLLRDAEGRDTDG